MLFPLGETKMIPTLKYKQFGEIRAELENDFFPTNADAAQLLTQVIWAYETKTLGPVVTLKHYSPVANGIGPMFKYFPKDHPKGTEPIMMVLCRLPMLPFNLYNQCQQYRVMVIPYDQLLLCRQVLTETPILPLQGKLMEFEKPD